jgi:hypothetical protein
MTIGSAESAAIAWLPIEASPIAAAESVFLSFMISPVDFMYWLLESYIPKAHRNLTIEVSAYCQESPIPLHIILMGKALVY